MPQMAMATTLPPNPSETCYVNWHRWQTARISGRVPTHINPTSHGFDFIDTALGVDTWYAPVLPFQPGLGMTPADNVPNEQYGRSSFDETIENSATSRAARTGEGFYGIFKFELEPNVAATIPLSDPAFVDGHAFMAFDSAGNPLERFPSISTLANGQPYIAATSQNTPETGSVHVPSIWADNSFEVDVPADGIVYVHYVLVDEGAAHRHALRYCPQDVSDAPIATYGLAAHTYDVDLRLGVAKDIDIALTNDLVATGDDNDGNGDNDEDGITLPTLTVGQMATIIADVTGAGGYLQGWIDFDGNGTFDTDEQVATDLQDGDGNGTIEISVSVPSDAVTTQIFARFRWSTTAGLDATSAAADGEVEDYALTIDVAAPSLSLTKVADKDTNVKVGETITYTYTVENTGDIIVRDIFINDTHNGSDPAPTPVNETLQTDSLPEGDSTDSTPNDGNWDVLAPGDVITFTGSYTVTETDAENL